MAAKAPASAAKGPRKASQNAAEDPKADAKKPPDPPAGGLDPPPAPAPLEAEAFPGQGQLPEDERDRVLILHFALPRTAMTFDAAAGRSTEVELNEALAAMSWGSVEADGGGWTLDSEMPTLEPPHPSLISYAEYVARSFPTDSSVPEGERERNERAGAAKRAVFSCPGEPGVKFRPMFDQMVKNLAHSNRALAKAYDIKKPVLNEEEVPEDPARPDQQAIMRYGRHQVLPSFWQLLISLTKRGRRFFLVLRTFSREQLSAMQRELNLFCQGQHPAYCGLNKTPKVPLMNGKGSRDMRLLDASIGCIDRAAGQMEFAGRAIPDPPPSAETAGDEAAVAPPNPEAAAPAPAPEPRQTVYSFPPFHEAYAGLQDHVLQEANTAAIVDDLAYWEANEHRPSAGKLLLVDHACGFAETKYQHIFFDGHIGGCEDEGCVDVRDAVSGEPVPFKEAQGTFLHRVDLFQATTDPEYYIKALDACENKMSQKILESKKVAQEAESAGEGAERERTRSLPTREWLHREILPALLPALEQTQRDRPEDPIEYLAFYMLRHGTMYSKSLKG